MPDEPSEVVKVATGIAVRTAFTQAVEHTTNVMVAPGLGKAAGQVANLGYEYVPDEVKVGAGLGGFLAVHMGTHIMAVGTAGSMVAGTAVLAAFLPWVATGAAIGGLCWVFRKINE